MNIQKTIYDSFGKSPVDFRTLRRKIARQLNVEEAIVANEVRRMVDQGLIINPGDLNDSTIIRFTNGADYKFAFRRNWSGFLVDHFLKEPVGALGVIIALVALLVSIIK